MLIWVAPSFLFSNGSQWRAKNVNREILKYFFPYYPPPPKTQTKRVLHLLVGLVLFSVVVCSRGQTVTSWRAKPVSLLISFPQHPESLVSQQKVFPTIVVCWVSLKKGEGRGVVDGWHLPSLRWTESSAANSPSQWGAQGFLPSWIERSRRAVYLGTRNSETPFLTSMRFASRWLQMRQATPWPILVL